MPELGYGTTDLSWDEPTSTPFDVERNSGGSSGGSAAAVAAGMAALALGTDGGGSIRIPASWCGVYGIKPTFRRIPRTTTTANNAFINLKPFSEFGPLARTVEDAALMLEVMVGPHSEDIFVLPDDGTDYRDKIFSSIKDFQIAYSPDLDIFPVENEVAEIITQAIHDFEQIGASIEEVSVGFEHSRDELCTAWKKWVDVSRATNAAILKNEGLDLLGTHRDDLHPEFIDCIERGQEITAVDYSITDTLRTNVTETLRLLFQDYDVLLTPTLSIPPVRNTEDEYTKGPSEVNGECVDKDIGWCLTYPMNFSGHPAASIPAGFTEGGLPVGLQIIGPRFGEERVLATSGAFERISPWESAYPPM